MQASTMFGHKYFRFLKANIFFEIKLSNNICKRTLTQLINLIKIYATLLNFYNNFKCLEAGHFKKKTPG